MFPPIDLNRVKKILLVRTDRMGDVVVTTPVFPAIKKKFPHSHLAILVSKENEDLVRGNSYLDEVICYDKLGAEKSWWGVLRFIFYLQKKHFDVAIHLHPRARTYLTSYLARIPIRIGRSALSAFRAATSGCATAGHG